MNIAYQGEREEEDDINDFCPIKLRTAQHRCAESRQGATPATVTSHDLNGIKTYAYSRILAVITTSIISGSE